MFSFFRSGLRALLISVTAMTGGASLLAVMSLLLVVGVVVDPGRAGLGSSREGKREG